MEKQGLKSLGLITNIKFYLNDLQTLLAGTDFEADGKVLDEAIERQKENSSLQFLNKFGYDHNYGTKLTLETAQILRVYPV